MILGEKQRTKYSNTQQYNQAIAILENIMELRRKQQERQSELLSLLVKEAKAIKYKSKPNAGVKQQATTKTLPPNKSGIIQHLFKAQQQKCSEESSTKVEGDFNGNMTVEAEGATEGREVPVEIVSDECVEKNTEEVSSQFNSKGDQLRARNDTVAQVDDSNNPFLSQERVKEIVQERTLTC